MDQTKSGRFIAEKRKEKGITQRELAKQLGIGDKAISKWECGRGMPDSSLMLHELNSLATCYGFIHKGKMMEQVSASDLAGDDLEHHYLSLLKNQQR